MAERQKEKTMTDLIRDNTYYPPCQRCKKPMDWLQFRENGKLIREEAICPRCQRNFEIVRLSSNGKITRLRPEPRGAFSLR